MVLVCLLCFDFFNVGKDLGRSFRIMRLLFCIKAMNNPGGGAERVLANVVEGFAARNYEVAVLSYDTPGGDSFYPLHKKIERIELGVGSTIDRATLLSTLRRMIVLRSKVQEYAPDLVIGFMHSMFIPLGLALVGTEIPMIASEHIVPEHYRTRPLERFLLRLVPFLAKRITCVSEQVRDSYPLSLQKKMVAVTNPIMIGENSIVKILGQHITRKRLLTVGRLEPQKDHQTLIQAFAKLSGRFPDWDLRILGDGGLRPKLAALINELGVSDRVFMPGTIKKIAQEYISAQLFVQPSLYESYGLTTAEALSYGLPVVGFADCQGTNQLVQPGINGYLASGRGNRVENLAMSLSTLMENEKLRIQFSEHALETLEPARIKNVLDQWESLIFEVIGEIT
jgi:glycosyltransferase involved in cell wall biosynthesis